MAADTLRARVTRLTAFAAVGSALFAMAIVTVVADRFVLSADDARLLSAAQTLAQELAVEQRTPAELANDEAAEVAHAGLRIGLFVNGQPLGGNVREQTELGCATIGRGRACAIALIDGRRIVVVSSTDPRAPLRRAVAIGALVALLVVGLAALVASRRAATWAILPLSVLRQRLEGVAPDGRGHEALGQPIECGEVEELRRALQDALGRLDRELGRARRFAASAAHELRTPLTMAMGELELAAPRDAAIGKARGILDQVNRVLDRLLILAAPPDRIELKHAVALSEVVSQALPRLGEPQRLRVETIDDPMVRGDEALLVLLVENVVGNALKFSTAEVQVRVAAKDGRVILDVIDDGPGVAPEERDRVFDPFHRGRAATDVDGQGIGLALVAHVAALHGGGARFLAVARGAHLQVDLPAWSERAPTRP